MKEEATKVKGGHNQFHQLKDLKLGQPIHEVKHGWNKVKG